MALKCGKHPRYKGLFLPKCDCYPCFQVYAHVQYDKFMKEKNG